MYGIGSNYDSTEYVVLKNTVIANNYDSTETNPSFKDDSLKIISLGHNFIDNLGEYVFNANYDGDLIGDTIGESVANSGATIYDTIINAKLSDLTGEDFMYRVPLIGSPLLDAADITADSLLLEKDMLDSIRPIHGGRDIGAIERQLIKVTATISAVTHIGFKVAFNPPLDTLKASAFSLDHSGVINSIATTDNGKTYSIKTNTLSEGIKYSLAINADWYDIKITGSNIYIQPSVIKSTTTGGNICFSPNPANTFVRLTGLGDLNANSVISVFDISGRKILERNYILRDGMQLDISGIAPGTYFVNVIAGSSIYSGKLLIK